MLLRLPVFRKSPYISSLISWGSNRVHQGVEMRQGRGCKSFILEVQMSGNGEDREGRKPVQGVLTSRLQQRAPGAQFCWGHLGDGTEHAAQVAHPGALFSISFLHWLRAAPSTIRSKLHLGQGMTKPAVRGRRDLAGAWYGQWNGQSCPRSAPFVAEGPCNFHSKNSRQGMSPNIKVCCSISPGE